MECHKCLHSEEVKAGKLRGVPFERTPCAQCELRENSLDTIAFDEEQGAKVDAVAGAIHFPGEQEDLVPISVMTEAMVEFLCMPPAVRDVVGWRFAGWKYSDIARVQGVTVAAVENRQRRAMQKWPALRGLFALKAAKQKRRMPHGGMHGNGKRSAKRGSA